jgi:hypothetical protein
VGPSLKGLSIEMPTSIVWKKGAMEKNSLVLILPVMLLKFIAIKPLTLYKLLSVTRGIAATKVSITNGTPFYLTKWYTLLPYSGTPFYQMVHPFTKWYTLLPNGTPFYHIVVHPFTI